VSHVGNVAVHDGGGVNAHAVAIRAPLRDDRHVDRRLGGDRWVDAVTGPRAPLRYNWKRNKNGAPASDQLANAPNPLTR